ncbi:MAG: dihydrodipicolinate synthase family protein, partial [Planctomycetota bacterium]
ALTKEERVKVFKCAASVVRKRVPLVAGVGAHCLDDIFFYIKEAKSAGVDYALLQPPSYFPMTDEMICGFYTSVLEKSSLPLVLYNIPIFNHKTLAPKIVKHLSKNKKVAAIKDSGGNIAYLKEIIKNCKSDSFNIIVGDESLICKGLKYGADGAMSSAAHIIPEVAVKCYEYAEKKNWTEAKKEQEKLLNLRDKYKLRGTLYEVISNIKNLLHKKGICRKYMAPIWERKLSCPE